MNYILHLGGDAFCASCEIARRPDLKNKPVVIGEERGIACAFSYEAKKLGIHRGMPIFKIRKEFPQVKILSSHFELYEEYRAHLVSILKNCLPIVETYSIDECFAVLPEISIGELGIFVRSLKKRVQDSLGITFSFGVALTKTLAKVASKKEKPDGCVFLLTDESVKNALRQTQVGAVWGIGTKTSAALLGENIKTAEDFINTPLETLKNRFHEPAIETWHELKGIKIFDVSNKHDDQKSIQSTKSLGYATNDENLLFSELSRNVEVACENLRAMEMTTNKVHMFYRLARGTKHRKWIEASLPVSTDDPKAILRELRPKVWLLWHKNTLYKATGVTLSGLMRPKSVQNDIFGWQEGHNQEKTYLRALDAINRKFGSWTIMHASSLRSVIKRREELFAREKKDSYEYGLPLPYMGQVF